MTVTLALLSTDKLSRPFFLRRIIKLIAERRVLRTVIPSPSFSFKDQEYLTQEALGALVRHKGISVEFRVSYMHVLKIPLLMNNVSGCDPPLQPRLLEILGSLALDAA